MQNEINLKFRADTHFSVSGETWSQVADQLGMTEEDAIHYAMAKLAGEQIKDFPFDDTPIGTLDYESSGKVIATLDQSYFSGEGNHGTMEKTSPGGGDSVVPVPGRGNR